MESCPRLSSVSIGIWVPSNTEQFAAEYDNNEGFIQALSMLSTLPESLKIIELSIHTSSPLLPAEHQVPWQRLDEALARFTSLQSFLVVMNAAKRTYGTFSFASCKDLFELGEASFVHSGKIQVKFT